MRIATARLLLRRVEPADSEAVRAYHVSNRAHLQPWEPLRTDDFYSLASVERRIGAMAAEMAADQALHLLLLARDGGELLGQCHFTNIVRGPFQACHLGFSLGMQAQGTGLMKEALDAAIPQVFDSLGLHRIMANYQPDNRRSEKLLATLGFEREGLAREYLKINGAWRDHVLTSKVNR